MVELTAVETPHLPVLMNVIVIVVIAIAVVAVAVVDIVATPDIVTMVAAVIEAVGGCINPCMLSFLTNVWSGYL